jgi:hypothetical protein
VAAADLAARDLVDGVRGIAARWLAARGALAGGEPRASSGRGDAKAHAQAGLEVVVLHGLALIPRRRSGTQWWRSGGVGGVGRGEGRDYRGLGFWGEKRHGGGRRVARKGGGTDGEGPKGGRTGL